MNIIFDDKRIFAVPAWVDVADTAVKIGLGAAITAASTFLLAGRNHSQAIARDLLAKRISILESACMDAEIFFSFCTYLYNTVFSYANANDVNGRDQTPEETMAITVAHDKIIEALDARNRASAKMALLGASDAIEHISAFNETLKNYRDVIARGGKMYAAREHDEITMEFYRHKMEFYAAASRLMRDIN